MIVKGGMGTVPRLFAEKAIQEVKLKKNKQTYKTNKHIKQT